MKQKKVFDIIDSFEYISAIFITHITNPSIDEDGFKIMKYPSHLIYLQQEISQKTDSTFLSSLVKSNTPTYNTNKEDA